MVVDLDIGGVGYADSSLPFAVLDLLRSLLVSLFVLVVGDVLLWGCPVHFLTIV